MLSANTNPSDYQRNLDLINNIAEKKQIQKAKFINK